MAAATRHTEGTIYWHLKQIYPKQSISRQADLVQSGPVARGAGVRVSPPPLGGHGDGRPQPVLTRASTGCPATARLGQWSCPPICSLR